MFIGLNLSKESKHKEVCVKCGMIANIDPWLHEDRYKHIPVVERNGKLFKHDGTGVFIEE